MSFVISEHRHIWTNVPSGTPQYRFNVEQRLDHPTVRTCPSIACESVLQCRLTIRQIVSIVKRLDPFRAVSVNHPQFVLVRSDL